MSGIIKQIGKAGRKKLDIDADEVMKLAALHCTNVEIAAFFDVDEGTIRKRFSEEVKKGKEIGKISLRRSQFKAAEKGNVTMQIWLGKQYLGQKEPEKTVTETTPELLQKYSEMIEGLKKNDEL